MKFPQGLSVCSQLYCICPNNLGFRDQEQDNWALLFHIVIYTLPFLWYYPFDALVAQRLVLVLPKHETRVRFPSSALLAHDLWIVGLLHLKTKPST